jgi:hypothetical protein
MGTGIVNVDVGSIITNIGQTIKDIRTAWTGKDVDLDAKLAQLEIQVQAASDASQSQVNAVEAVSNSKFVQWWRPAVAWVCVCFCSHLFVFSFDKLYHGVFWQTAYNPTA